MDVVATNFVVPIAEEIPAWDDVPSMRLRNYVAVDDASDVAARPTDFVVPIADEIPVWDDVVIALATWML